MRIYEVGGCVRDEILGVKSKDIDFTVVLEHDDFYIRDGLFANDPFKVMVTHLDSMGFKIFLETPEYLTVRAQFPKGMDNRHTRKFFAKNGNLTADFVLARKEGEYTDGRRPDRVIPGTLEDDLRRRDFTMNAIAKDPNTGEYIDPFDGQRDIADKVIRAVGDPYERFTEDALRPLRAIRFAVTKGFTIAPTTRHAMQNPEVLALIRNKISDERKREELNKMFAFDTVLSMRALSAAPALTDAIFSGSVSLEATMKQRKV